MTPAGIGTALPRNAGRETSTQYTGKTRTAVRAAILVLGVALIGLAWSETMARLRSSERFGLVALEVSGIRLLSGDEVLDASGLAVGDNIFAVDLDAVALRLESLVWVRDARLERRPPDRLIVRINERRRDAWIDVRGQLFGLDAGGVLLPEQAMPAETPLDLDLPVIRNVPAVTVDAGTGTGEKLEAGDRLADSSLVAILGWWQRARLLDEDFSAQISELQPFGADGLRVILGGDGLEIRLPRRGALLRQHLLTLNRALPILFAAGARPGYVDLRFADQLVVGRPAAAPGHRVAPGQSARQPGARLTGRTQALPGKERPHHG